MNLDDVRKEFAADSAFMQKHWHNPRIGPVDGEDAMREELLAVEQSLAAGTLTAEAWEQYQLHWQAYIGEFKRTNYRLGAHMMLAFEFERRTNPEKIARNPEAIRLLHWWLDEGGREDYLGKLPIADRRALEERASRWPENFP